MPLDDAARLFDTLDPKIWLLTTAAGSLRGGLIATSVMQASIVPERPRVIVTVARQHHTWQVLETSGVFALHLLSENQIDLVWRFGLQSGRDTDKFAGLSFDKSPQGNPLLAGSNGWLDCRVECRMETGDRTVYLAAVTNAGFEDGGPALTLSKLLAAATDETRRDLKAQLTRDAAIDRDAIDRWRSAR